MPALYVMHKQTGIWHPYGLAYHGLLQQRKLGCACQEHDKAQIPVQANRDVAASVAADQLRREQLALKQSKQLIPILAPASKGKPYKSPAAAHSTTSLANGVKGSALLNGGMPRKSSLESLGRMSSQASSSLAAKPPLNASVSH
jgi:hypothetical protein